MTVDEDVRLRMLAAVWQLCALGWMERPGALKDPRVYVRVTREGRAAVKVGRPLWQQVRFGSLEPAEQALVRAVNQLSHHEGNPPSLETVSHEVVVSALGWSSWADTYPSATELSRLNLLFCQPYPGPGLTLYANFQATFQGLAWERQQAALISGGDRVLEQWDVFISHASEDKDAVARPLAEALQVAGLRVWFDEFALTVGDSLRRSIDRGLAQSRFGVVVLSPAFFAKQWPAWELDGLVQRELAREGSKVILPVWHNVSAADVRGFSPSLADKLGVSTTPGIPAVAQALLRAIQAPQR